MFAFGNCSRLLCGIEVKAPHSSKYKYRKCNFKKLKVMGHSVSVQPIAPARPS